MDWSIGKDDKSAFRMKLVAMAKSIRQEARGRKCGGCIFYFGGSCDRFEVPVLVALPDAPACKRYQKRRVRKRTCVDMR